MSSTGTTTVTTSRPARLPRRQRRWTGLLAASLLGLALTGCSAAETATPAPAGGSSSSAPAGSSAADALTVDITIADGDVTPNGQKIDVAVGQPVVLNVTSDSHDEIHAHTDGDGYALEVQPGVPATGTFTLTGAGSFEVESHHLEKVIVILNAR